MLTEMLRRIGVLPKTVDTALDRFQKASDNLYEVAERDYAKAAKLDAKSEMIKVNAKGARDEAQRADRIRAKMQEVFELS